MFNPTCVIQLCGTFDIEYETITGVEIYSVDALKIKVWVLKTPNIEGVQTSQVSIWGSSFEVDKTAKSAVWKH